MADHVTARSHRYVLYAGDPQRNYAVMWSRGVPSDPLSLGLVRSGDKGDLDAVTLISESGTRYPAKTKFLRERVEYESWHWKAFEPTDGIPLGKYKVEVAGRTVGEIQIKGVPYQATQKITPGELYANDFVLRPNTNLWGYSATLVGNLRVSAGCTIRGLTIDGNVTGDFQDVVFDSCVFRRGMVGPNNLFTRGTTFRDCEFKNYTIYNIASGLFLRCTITGRSAVGAHNFNNERGIDLACIGLTFDETDRGFILRPKQDNVYECLIAGTLMKNLCFTNNGNELLDVEGRPFSFKRNMMFNLRTTNCDGSITLFDSDCEDNLFNNVRAPFDITGMGVQRNNIIMDSECEYVRINWDNLNGAQYTHLQRVYSVGFVPRARNQATGDRHWWADPRWSAVFQDKSPTPTTTGANLHVDQNSLVYASTLGITRV